MAKNRFDKETISKNISRKYIRKNILNKLMILGTERKKRQKKVMSEKNIRGYTTGEEGCGSKLSFAR